MNWRDDWNRDKPIHVSERHRLLHYRLVASGIINLIPSREAAVLDYGCGEALFAHRIADQCGHLYLCDAAPVRERLCAKFDHDSRITILSPDDLPVLEDGSLDLILMHSLLQYLSLEEFRSALKLWRDKLKPDGKLVIADVIPPDMSPSADAKALLSFAWKGGFLFPAALSLARTAFSDYRSIREDTGLSQYSEAEMIDILGSERFSAERADSNMGYDPARMTFVARPSGN